MKIVISPDEDPGDPGSVAADGTHERDLNIRVAGALQLALHRCGQDVWFDPTITFVNRVSHANAAGYELLVACAHNASIAGASGTEFVFCPGGEEFGRQAAAADAVYGELATIPGWPGRRSNVVENIYECCSFDGDTVYCELLFMSEPDDAIWLRPEYPELAAEAMCKGLAAAYGFEYADPHPQPAPAPAPPPPPAAEESRPVVTTIFAGQIHVFYVDPTGILQHTWWAPGQTSWEKDAPGSGYSPNALLTVQNGYQGQLHLFGLAAASGVRHTWYTPGQGWAVETLAG